MQTSPQSYKCIEMMIHIYCLRFRPLFLLLFTLSPVKIVERWRRAVRNSYIFPVILSFRNSRHLLFCWKHLTSIDSRKTHVTSSIIIVTAKRVLYYKRGCLSLISLRELCSHIDNAISVKCAIILTILLLFAIE